MGEGIGHHGPVRLLLQAIVADGAAAFSAASTSPCSMMCLVRSA